MTPPDGVYFDTVLRELAQHVRRATGEDVTFFTERVAARIEHGARLYGDRAFLAATRDNLLEAEDEAADLVAYPLFELQRLNLDPAAPPDGVHQLLFAAMTDAAVAALKLRHVRRLLSQP